MAILLQFNQFDKAERAMEKPISVLRPPLRDTRGANPDELFERLLELLDGPEALEVYNRAMQTY